jgi:glycosyltransferase involved in cell wall biosynthesis
MQDEIAYTPNVARIPTSLDSSYPLKVAYDAKAFVDADHGTGKGAQLRTLLGSFGPLFTGLAPPGPNNSSLPLIQRGTSRYLLWQQTALPRLLAELKPDVFLAPYNTAPLRIPSETKLVSVVHDLILLETLSEAPIARRLRDAYRAVLLEHAIRRSSLVLTVSQFTAGKLRQRYPESNLRVINCTVPPSWFVRNQLIPTEHRGLYILMVTSNVAHKNIPRALAAFARYKALDPSSKLKLNMVGVSSSAEFFRAMAENLGIRDSLVIEPFLSETDLQTLYRNALCVLIPSEIEGFGIPALEAMSSGTPIVSSNASSLPEVCGSAPLYFDPRNVEEMAQSLLRICTDAPLRRHLIKEGLDRAERFHPDRIRDEVTKFWRELPALHSSWKK